MDKTASVLPIFAGMSDLSPFFGLIKKQQNFSFFNIGHQAGVLKMTKFSRFQKDTKGTVTVDFVIITAAVVGLAVSFFVAIEESAHLLSVNTATEIVGSAAD